MYMVYVYIINLGKFLNWYIMGEFYKKKIIYMYVYSTLLNVKFIERNANGSRVNWYRKPYVYMYVYVCFVIDVCIRMFGLLPLLIFWTFQTCCLEFL